MFSESEQECLRCEGNGFVETDYKDVILCPDCHGERKLRIQVRDTCSSCGGRGFYPKILQRFQSRSQCPICGGSGSLEIDPDDAEYEIECDECDGNGVIGLAEYFSFPEWKKHPLHAYKLQAISWTDEGVAVRFESESGHLVEIVRCEECKNTDSGYQDPLDRHIAVDYLFWVGCGLNPLPNSDPKELADEEDEASDEPLDEPQESDLDGLTDASEFESRPCPKCECLRKLVRIIKFCPKCGGSGLVCEEQVDCWECDGSGIILHEEVREV